VSLVTLGTVMFCGMTSNELVPKITATDSFDNWLDLYQENTLKYETVTRKIMMMKILLLGT